MSDYGDAVAAALRADAEAARDEIRAAGIVCPSCGKNLGDLYGKGHRYEDPLDGTGAPRAALNLSGTFRCTEGQPVDVAGLDFDQITAAVNIGFMDYFWQLEGEYMDKHIIGTGNGKGFTGLLGML